MIRKGMLVSVLTAAMALPLVASAGEPTPEVADANVPSPAAAESETSPDQF